MNVNKINKIFNVFALAIITSMCSPKEDFKTPELVIEEPEIKGTIITIDAVLGILNRAIENEGENAKVVFENTDSFIEGYVVSSDKASNFFKELVIQDKEANPTSGIRVLIDDNPLFTTYGFGRKVYIKLNGLSIGTENGVPTLGILEGNSIAAIPSFSLNQTVIRSAKLANIIPLKITLEDITDNLLNLYVKVNNLQFTKNLVLPDNAFTFAAEANDKYDGERILESCTTGRTIVLSTSTFSDFKGLKLSAKQGSFEGIVTKNFLGDKYNLMLNDPTKLLFDNETRCDPIVLECPVAVGGSTWLFKENFTDLKIRDLEDAEWINSNITGGKLVYKIGDFANNQYAQVTGFNSKESLYEIWLITPEIDLNSVSGAVLNFDVQAGYDNGNILEVFITKNYIENPKDTSWIKLDATIPRGPLNSFGDFAPAGPISLSCIESTVRIGFRYIGGDPRATTRYHIDNITVQGN